MDRPRTARTSAEGPSEVAQTPLRPGCPLPADLEELDRRLEAALPSIAGFHADELCVWACACFLVDGGFP